MYTILAGVQLGGLYAHKISLPNVKHDARIQFPTTTRNVKYKIARTDPLSPIPPYARIPSYITAFQSSPVKICEEKTTFENFPKLHFLLSSLWLVAKFSILFYLSLVISLKEKLAFDHSEVSAAKFSTLY